MPEKGKHPKKEAYVSLDSFCSIEPLAKAYLMFGRATPI